MMFQIVRVCDPECVDDVSNDENVSLTERVDTVLNDESMSLNV